MLRGGRWVVAVVVVIVGVGVWFVVCLWWDNAGVLRCAGCVQKSPVDQKVKSFLDFSTFSKKTDRECSCRVVLSSTTT